VHLRIERYMIKCQTESDLLARHEKPKKKLFDEQRRQCAKEEKGIDTLVHCRSANNLLASNEYDKHYRSMFTALWGFHVNRNLPILPHMDEWDMDLRVSRKQLDIPSQLLRNIHYRI
jgi:hypothetical protein